MDTPDGLVQRSGRVEIVGNDDAVADELAWLVRNDISPRRLRVTESTLEDAYLDLTYARED